MATVLWNNDPSVVKGLMPITLALMNKMKKLLIRKSSQNLNLNQTGDPPHQIEHWTYFKDPSNKKS